MPEGFIKRITIKDNKAKASLYSVETLRGAHAFHETENNPSKHCSSDTADASQHLPP